MEIENYNKSKANKNMNNKDIIISISNDSNLLNRNPKNNFLSNEEKKSKRKNNKNTFKYNFQLISSLFSKENIKKSLDEYFGPSQEEEVNSINSLESEIKNNNNLHVKDNIYDLNDCLIYQLKIFGKFIKYYPIINDLTEDEKLVAFNPILEKNKNFKVLLDINNFLIMDCYLEKYNVAHEQFINLKEIYLKDVEIKSDIKSINELIKQLFLELKITLCCINVKENIDENLKKCSIMIDNINNIVEYMMKNSKPKNVILSNKKNINNKNIDVITDIYDPILFLANSDQNSSLVSKNNEMFYENSNNNLVDDNANLNFISSNSNKEKNKKLFFSNIDNKNMFSIINVEKEKGNINKEEDKNKKDLYYCQICNLKFTSHCGLGGHISKRHPKSKIKLKEVNEQKNLNTENNNDDKNN